MRHQPDKHSSTVDGKSISRTSLAAVGLMVAVSYALAATPSADDKAEQARYEKERAVCLSGKSNQDQATCLKEAGAAREEAKRGQLNDGPVQYRKNQLERCDKLPPNDMEECRARIKHGEVSGTPEAGGVIRELRTVVPAEAASAPK